MPHENDASNRKGLVTMAELTAFKHEVRSMHQAHVDATTLRLDGFKSYMDEKMLQAQQGLKAMFEVFTAKTTAHVDGLRDDIGEVRNEQGKVHERLIARDETMFGSKHIKGLFPEIREKLKPLEHLKYVMAVVTAYYLAMSGKGIWGFVVGHHLFGL